MAWDYDVFGPLGDGGTNTEKNVPTAIAVGTNWQAVSAGGYHSLGIHDRVPYTPQRLGASLGGVGQVNLIWDAPIYPDPSDPVIDYVVEYSTDNFVSDIQTYAEGVSVNTSANITGLSSGVDYYFRIKAINSVGKSDPSASRMVRL